MESEAPRPDPNLHRLLLGSSMGQLPRPQSPAESVSVWTLGVTKRNRRLTYLYTSDPCVLDEDADLLLVVDVTELDLRGAVHEIGTLFQREVDDIDAVTRAALETRWHPSPKDDDVKVQYPLGKSSLKYRQSPKRFRASLWTSLHFGCSMKNDTHRSCGGVCCAAPSRN